jgi:hypothetical protein
MNSSDEQLLKGDTIAAKTDSARFYIKTILVPIDFSDLSQKALRYAAPFAQQHRARIIVTTSLNQFIARKIARGSAA